MNNYCGTEVYPHHVQWKLLLKVINGYEMAFMNQILRKFAITNELVNNSVYTSFKMAKLPGALSG